MPRFLDRRWFRRGLGVTVLLAIGIALPGVVALASHQFGDVPDSNPFHNDIDAIADAGVTTGCGGGNYCPAANVTREQMAAFFNRLGALGPGTTPVVNADKVDGLDASDLAPFKVGEVETTAKVGGTGGGAYTLPCPAGSIATGLKGDLGSIEAPTVGHVSVECTPVTTGGFVLAFGTPTQTGTSGDGGGAPYTIDCTGGQVMTGVTGSTKPVFGGAATVVASLSIQCTPIGGVAGAQTTAVVGQPNPMGATPFSLACPAGKVVTGLGPANGDQLLDAIRVRCQ